MAELILGPQDWGDQLSLCVLRAKSKDGFAGPPSCCLLGKRQGFQVLFIPVAFDRTVQFVHTGERNANFPTAY